MGTTQKQIQKPRRWSVERRAQTRQVVKRRCSLRNTPTCEYQVHMCIHVPAPGREGSSLQLKAGYHWGRGRGVSRCAAGFFWLQVSSLSLGFPETRTWELVDLGGGSSKHNV